MIAKDLLVNGVSRFIGKIYGNLKGNITVPYCDCTTSTSTAAKVVTCDGFELEEGARIIIYFPAANTATNPTLNVNGTGAKQIYYRDAPIQGNNPSVGFHEFIYNAGSDKYHYLGEVPSVSTVNVGSASNWDAGTLPTTGTAISADDITAWTTNTATTPMSFSFSGITLTLTAGSKGTAASLSYTSRSIPNVTGVGTLPKLTVTSTSVVNGVS